MHPPDLKMLETNSGVRGSGGSFCGKSQASSSNTKEGNSRSHVVVMAGRWIKYDNGGWDFKIDNERMGRAVDFLQIKGVNGLKDIILASYGLLGRDLEVEMCYWLIDGESEMVGKRAAPVEIATTTDYKIFKTTEGVQGLKDKDSRAAVDGVNPASGNMLQQEKQKSCALGTVVENESKKRAHVKQLKMPFVGLIRIICINKTEGVVDGLVVTIMSVLWSPKLEVKGLEEANGQGGSSSGKQCCNMRHYEDNTDNLRDFVCTSRIIDFSYTEDSDICGSVDVVNITPPKDRNQQNHDDDFVDRRFTKSSSETVSCTQSDETNTGASIDLGEANPPEKHNTHSRVIKDEDLFVDPHVRISSQFQGGEAFMKGIQVSEMYGYNDAVLVFNDIEGIEFQPQDIDFNKEDSDIFVGRQFKDKAQFKLTMSIYALAEVCRFKFRHCKRYGTAKCVDKKCTWRVCVKQVGDYPTYFVKNASLGHQCTSDVRGQYKKHGTSRVLAALLRSKYERLHCGPRAIELPEVLRTEFNYTCTYKKAWKAKELAIACAAIFAAKDKWYPSAHHGICLEHLKRNVGDKYKRMDQKQMVARAADAFKMLGLPCRHAITAASFRKMEYALLVSQYHVKDTWSETVKGIILPVPNPKDINISADILKVDLYPPKTKRTKGKPGIKRKLGASDYAEGPRKKKKLNKCSRSTDKIRLRCTTINDISSMPTETINHSSMKAPRKEINQTAEGEGVEGSKDKDSGAAVDGVNPASGNMLQQDKQKSCALGTGVENGSKKRAHVETAEDAVCETAEGVQGSKDKDSGAAVDGVNPASGNMLQQEKQKSCALGTVVENGSKKRAHVEAAEDAFCGVNPDNMHQQNYTLQEKEKRANIEAQYGYVF
ncbi:hypothetical protein YC2023_106991 [Brassica napus]